MHSCFFQKLNFKCSWKWFCTDTSIDLLVVSYVCNLKFSFFHIQNVEKKISQLRDRELHKISQHDLEDVYDALRNLNLKFWIRPNAEMHLKSEPHVKVKWQLWKIIGIAHIYAKMSNTSNFKERHFTVISQRRLILNGPQCIHLTIHERDRTYPKVFIKIKKPF